MREFNYSLINDKTWDTETLRLIAAIYKTTGRQEILLKQRAQELEKLTDIARIQSTKFSNALEGIRASDNRIKQLVADHAIPRNRMEEQISGYRDALEIIYESSDAIPITRSYILFLHMILFSQTGDLKAGSTKTTQTYIDTNLSNDEDAVYFKTASPEETPIMLDRICEEYNRVIAAKEVDPLLAIAVFIRDFLCINPFTEGNSRMSRLLTSLLLYKNGFLAGKYISLEAKVAEDPELCRDVLFQSMSGWHEGTDDPVPFIKYQLQNIRSVCDDFEDRLSLVETKHSALETVQLAAKKLEGKFNKQDIRKLCPSLSISSIEGALRKMTESGELIREGIGKSTYYYSSNPQSDADRYLSSDLTDLFQTGIF